MAVVAVVSSVTNKYVRARIIPPEKGCNWSRHDSRIRYNVTV